MTITVAVAGATGRLGTVICDVVDGRDDFELIARLDSSSDPDDGADAQVLIDVTHPDASPDIVERALRHGQRVIIGTSGWSADRIAGLQALMGEIPGSVVVMIPNFAVATAVAEALVLTAAPHFDSIEILESHHPGKVDSPSGTAVRTAERIAELKANTRGGTPLQTPFAEQPARGQTVEGIAVHSLRQAGYVAQQEVRFGSAGARVTVMVDVIDPAAAYRAGIEATLEFIADAHGFTLGLDRVLGLEL